VAGGTSILENLSAAPGVARLLDQGQIRLALLRLIAVDANFGQIP
jgi:hypothetical protein